MRTLTRSIGLLIALSAVAVSGTVLAQSWGPRNLEELKEETLNRTRSGWRGIKPEDAERAVADLDALDPDVWAAAWSRIGGEYLARAAELEPSSFEQARENYYHAWRNFNMGRWPTEKQSAGKRQAYESALEAFQHYGRLLDPPIETVRIPFEGTELVAYLRLPEGVRPAPLVFALNGIDSRKEDVIVNVDAFISNGVGVFAIDMPGTGQAPILADIGAERMYSRALDYLETRSDVDASRIVVQGRSWSGYWAAVLAYTERDRIRGASLSGATVHDFFQPEWLEKTLATPEYLFDLLPARAAIYGVKTMEEYLAYSPRMSLVTRGLIDQPSAPMLLIAGEQDTQQPISDLYLLMKHGDPKLVWVNPEGGHGADSERYSSGWIRENVIQPWLLGQLAAMARAR